MKTIIVNNAIVLNQVKKHVGKVEEFFTAIMNINGKRINVTYDCKKNNLIIHEWYKLEPDALELITLLVSTCFNRIIVQEIFSAAVTVMDRYTAELEMDFPAAEIERRNGEMMEMLAEIDRMGLSAEFTEYACLA